MLNFVEKQSFWIRGGNNVDLINRMNKLDKQSALSPGNKRSWQFTR